MKLGDMEVKQEESYTKEVYKLARNEYVWVRREEEKRYGKDIVDKCKKEPKLFYRFINVKLKRKESIAQLKENKEVYEDPKEISVVLNKNFLKVFTTKYKLEQNIISIEKEEKDLEVVIQDNLSPDKQIDRIFGDTFMLLRNIQMAFHFLD